MNAKKPNLTADLPRAKAQAKHVGMTPMKARRIVNLIRGTDAAGAIAMLRFAPQAAAEPVAKLIASAVANAEHNQGLNPETLFIETAYVDEGPTLKRFQPRAQGRAFRIRKRTCHITIELVSVEREAGADTASRGSRSGRTAASRGAATSSAASKGRTR